jgi:hypothetical protein
MVKPFGVVCVVTNDSPHTTYYALVQKDIVKRVRRVSCSMALDQHKGKSFLIEWDQIEPIHVGHDELAFTPSTFTFLSEAFSWL